jgi:DNA-binding IclR family transcriptional regulator
MTGSLTDRAFAVLELLAAASEGAALSDIAARLDIPTSGAHRLLAELVRLGYARQNSDATYALTAKIVRLSHAWLGERGVFAAVQPTLDRLARQTGELVRYAVVDGDRLAWVASAQGVRFGLRFEPDMGAEAALYCTAAGYAWLACLSDEEAMRLVMNQGFGRLGDDGPGAPRTIDALQNQISLARSRGCARAVDSSGVGTTSLAAPVRHPTSQAVVGVLDISGPSARLGEARLNDLSPALLAACVEIAPFAGWPATSRLQQRERLPALGRSGQYA